jgi:predicted nucleotidyltransferase
MTTLPGTIQHQTILKALSDHYGSDPRVRSFAVFGSLGRGNWDEYSDIDLNVVVADGVDVDPIAEWDILRPALARIDERVALVVPSARDAVDIVFESLMELSIRYHPLATTSPNIIDSAIVLHGSLTVDDLAAAARGRVREPAMSVDDVFAECVRYALYCERSLYRDRLWSAAYALHRIRMGLMEAFGMTHGGFRGWMSFETDADPALQNRLTATVALHTATSMRESLLSLIDVLEHHAEAFTDGRASVGEGGRVVLARLRERVAVRA